MISNIATMKTVVDKVYINEDGKKIMFTCVGSLSQKYHAPINSI